MFISNGHDSHVTGVWHSKIANVVVSTCGICTWAYITTPADYIPTRNVKTLASLIFFLEFNIFLECRNRVFSLMN